MTYLHGPLIKHVNEHETLAAETEIETWNYHDDEITYIITYYMKILFNRFTLAKEIRSTFLSSLFLSARSDSNYDRMKFKEIEIFITL